MPHFSINVLCSDPDETCEYVQKKLMSDYNIKKGTHIDEFDHRGIKSFPSLDDAVNEARSLRERSDGRILFISVSPA